MIECEHRVEDYVFLARTIEVSDRVEFLVGTVGLRMKTGPRVIWTRQHESARSMTPFLAELMKDHLRIVHHVLSSLMLIPATHIPHMDAHRGVLLYRPKMQPDPRVSLENLFAEACSADQLRGVDRPRTSAPIQPTNSSPPKKWRLRR